MIRQENSCHHLLEPHCADGRDVIFRFFLVTGFLFCLISKTRSP
jgi:hypothetical protein